MTSILLQRARQAVDNAGLSKTDVARMLHVTPQRIHAVMTKDGNHNLELLELILATLDPDALTSLGDVPDATRLAAMAHLRAWAVKWGPVFCMRPRKGMSND